MKSLHDGGGRGEPAEKKPPLGVSFASGGRGGAVWRGPPPSSQRAAPRDGRGGDIRAEPSRGWCRSHQKSCPEGETALEEPHRTGGAVGTAVVAARALESAPRYGRGGTDGLQPRVGPGRRSLEAAPGGDCRL